MPFDGLNVSVGVMFERWMFYRGVAGKDAALLATLHEALVDRDLDKARRLLSTATAPGGRIAVAGRARAWR